MNGIFSFSQESKALSLCEERASLIAKNIAHSNTPGYQARDINFEEAMRQAGGQFQIAATHQNHIKTQTDGSSQKLYYRIPMQQKMDNNTVDDEIERKNFIQNALQYQANISFIQNKSNQLIKAFRGE